MYYILQGSEIEWASQYKYVGKTIHSRLHLAFGEKIEIETWCLLSCLFLARKTFMSLFGYGDVIYIHGSPECLHILHSVYSGTMGFITNFKTFTHPCALYAELEWSALSCCRFSYYVYLYVDFFIYKAIFGLLLIYWLILIRNCRKLLSWVPCFTTLSVPEVQMEFGKGEFKFITPKLKLKTLVSLN